MFAYMSDEYRPTAAEFQSNLDSFRGDLVYYRVHGCMLTPGVHYVFSTCGGWLVTDIIFFQRRVKLRSCWWQWWQLAVGADKSAVLKCTNGESKALFRASTRMSISPPITSSCMPSSLTSRISGGAVSSRFPVKIEDCAAG